MENHEMQFEDVGLEITEFNLEGDSIEGEVTAIAIEAPFKVTNAKTGEEKAPLLMSLKTGKDKEIHIYFDGGLKGKVKMGQVCLKDYVKITYLGKKDFELKDGTPARCNDYRIQRAKNYKAQD
jgi:hypothetical protein